MAAHTDSESASCEQFVSEHHDPRARATRFRKSKRASYCSRSRVPRYKSTIYNVEFFAKMVMRWLVSVLSDHACSCDSSNSGVLSRTVGQRYASTPKRALYFSGSDVTNFSDCSELDSVQGFRKHDFESDSNVRPPCSRLAHLTSPSSSSSYHSVEGGDATGEDVRRQSERASEDRAHQARVDEVEKLLEELEEQHLGTEDPAEKRRLKKAIREADRKRHDLRATLERFRLGVNLGEFQNQIVTVQSEVRQVASNQAALSNRQAAVERVVEEEIDARKTLEDKFVALQKEVGQMKKTDEEIIGRVQHLEAGQQILCEDNSTMRRGLNALDSRQRIQSLVFYGIDPSRIDEEIAGYLPPALMAGVDVVRRMESTNPEGFVAVSVRFTTVRFCELTAQFLQSPEFRKDFPDLSWSYNRTEMERVGRTRMMACWDALEQQFGSDIEIRPTFVRFFGQKYTAIDFAAARVRIGGTEFDIDAAVAANPEFEENPAAKVKYGGRTFNGCRRRGRGRGGGGTGGRGRGGRANTGGQPPLTRARTGDLAPPPTHAHEPVVSRPGTQTAPPERERQPPSVNNGTAGFGGNAATSQRHPQHRLSNYLPPMSGTSSGGVTYFANSGKYGSSKAPNRMGAHQERYAPYHV